MIQIKGLNVDYFGNSALEGVTLDIPFGHSVGIIGPNGAGKSTFIKALLDVIKKRSGTVKAEGKDIALYRRNIAYVPQKNDIDLTFPITVKDTVLTGTYPNLKLFRRPGKKERTLRSAAWRWWRSVTLLISRLAICPAGSCSGCLSLGRWPRRPVCFSWMSRLSALIWLVSVSL